MILGAVTAAVGAVIAGAFSWRLMGHHRVNRRGHALAWALALGLYAVGMVALATGLAVGWTPAAFGVYWAAGALLNVALLAVGQLLLLDPARGVLWWAAGAAAAGLTIAAVVVSPQDGAALASATAQGRIPEGEAVFGGQALAWTILRPVTLTSFAIVLVGSLWSGLSGRRWGVLLIAAGVTVAATSSVFLRTNVDAAVPAALTAGVAIMYFGFRAAGGSRRGRAEPSGAGGSRRGVAGGVAPGGVAADDRSSGGPDGAAQP